MARPCKCRRIGFCPEITYFKPAGIPVSDLAEVVLTIDELEAMRLADLEGYYQEDAAARMDVSRQTFGNMLDSAHRKIAEALVTAKAIKIEGGVYTMESKRQFRCADCQHGWEEQAGTDGRTHCPQCDSANIQCPPRDKESNRAGNCGRGRGRCKRRNV